MRANQKVTLAGSWSFFPAVFGKSRSSPSLTLDACSYYLTASSMPKVVPLITMSLGSPARLAALAALQTSVPPRRNSDIKCWSQRVLRSFLTLSLVATSMPSWGSPASMFSKKRSTRSCSRESPAWPSHYSPVTAEIPVSTKIGLSKW